MPETEVPDIQDLEVEAGAKASVVVLKSLQRSSAESAELCTVHPCVDDQWLAALG